jgi:hypothetical protein
MEDIGFIESTLDRLKSVEAQSRSYLYQQDIAYAKARLTDILRDYTRLTRQIEELERRLEGEEIDERELEFERSRVEEEIVDHLMQLLERNPQAAREYKRLQRLRRYGLQPREEERYQEIREEYLDTFGHLRDIDSETLDSYELPNGVTIWFDYRDTLEQGYNRGRADIFVTIEDKTYRLPMRPEFLDRLRELYLDAELDAKREADLLKLETLENRREAIVRLGVEAAQEALYLLA